MAFDVIDADQWLIQSERHCFRIGNSHQQRPNETRSNCYGDSVDLVLSKVCSRERFFDDRNNLVEMFARGEFRHHSAKPLMRFDL